MANQHGQRSLPVDPFATHTKPQRVYTMIRSGRRVRSVYLDLYAPVGFAPGMRDGGAFWACVVLRVGPRKCEGGRLVY
jgi:hypothetical protein